jgi:putative ABC transport system permease protein
MRLAHSLLEGLASALQAIIAHGFRSALTTLGIVIGIAAVIAVVSIMDGLGRSIGSQLDDLAPDMVTLKAHTSTDMEMLGITNRVRYDDYLYLKQRVDGIEAMAARMRPYSLTSEVRFDRKTVQTQMIGTESGYQFVVNTFPEAGRFLNQNDDRQRRRVAVIGRSVVEELELPDDPVGEFIQIEGEWFQVVGVAEARGSLFGIDQDNYVVAPLSTVQAVVAGPQDDDIQIVFRPSREGQTGQIIQTMRQLLRQKHKMAAGEPDFFEFESAERTRQRFRDISNSITFVAAGIVGISLIVGGIGIMNIMLVSVTERTREIGLSKSLGATSNAILVQFLVEACILALFGGVIGIALGYAAAVLMVAFLPLAAGVTVPAWSAWLALSFSGIIGIIFGIAPAIKAARLDPIDALRYE